MSQPILRLSDGQLDQILFAARPLDPDQRGAFLEDVARALAGRELGDGVVHRVTMEVQRRYWRAPDLSRAAGTSKWR